MKSFSAFTHINMGQEIRFVGDCWEENGFTINEQGEPTHDCQGNTIAKFCTYEIDKTDADLLAESYAGGEPIGDGDLFAQFLANEAGLDNPTIAEVCAALDVTYSAARLTEFRKVLALPPEQRIRAMVESPIL